MSGNNVKSDVHDEANVKINRLIKYCNSLSLDIHPSLKPRPHPSGGLGLFASSALPKNSSLVKIPVNAILTTYTIPNSFLSDSARRQLSVHAQLAAFFAFGSADDLAKYKPWLETWPSMEGFVEGMPIFWGDRLLVELEKVGVDISELEQSCMDSSDSNSAVKKQRNSNDDGITAAMKNVDNISKRAMASLSPALSGTFESHDRVSTSSTQSRHGLLPKILSKLAEHIISVAAALPQFPLLTSSPTLTSFLYNWCIVNTRCFHYIPPISNSRSTKRSTTKSSKAHTSKYKAYNPSDPDSCMALMPFIDLFNHTSATDQTTANYKHNDAKVSYDKSGFVVTTQKSHTTGEEIYISYGEHSNDTLWNEYGFMLPDNTSDNVDISPIVLASLTDLQKEKLEGKGYLGEYVLDGNGDVCWRTEVAAWMGVLSEQQWERVVDEGVDPVEGADESGVVRKQEVIAAWLEVVREKVEENLRELEDLTGDRLVDNFGTVSVVQGSLPTISRVEKLAQAMRRRDMSMARWRQIGVMAKKGLDTVKEEIK